MERKALLFIEQDIIKIVFGSSLKCIKTSEMSTPVNSEFFKKLFAAAKVFVLTGFEPIEYEKFMSNFPSVSTQEISSAIAQPAKRPSPPPLPKAPAVPQRTASTPAPAAKAKTTFIKSNAKSIIMIDDLPTGLLDSKGGREVLTIQPGGAVNVAALDPQALRSSVILKKLLQNGTLAPCSSSEALELNDEVFRKQQEFEDLKHKQMTTPPGERTGGMKARDMARNGMMVGGTQGDSEISDRNTSELDITSDVLRAGSGGSRTGRIDSMETLMEMIEEDASLGPPPKRVLEPRTPIAQARPGPSAIPIRRFED